MQKAAWLPSLMPATSCQLRLKGGGKGGGSGTTSQGLGDDASSFEVIAPDEASTPSDLGDEVDVQVETLAEAAEFWAPIGERELHWFNASQSAWLRVEDGRWVGWHASTAAPSSLETWRAWQSPCDATLAPLRRWYAGGKTNAAFNELDRHMLRGCTGLSFVSDPADGAAEPMTLQTLFIES